MEGYLDFSNDEQSNFYTCRELRLKCEEDIGDDDITVVLEDLDNLQFLIINLHENNYRNVKIRCSNLSKLVSIKINNFNGTLILDDDLESLRIITFNNMELTIENINFYLETVELILRNIIVEELILDERYQLSKFISRISGEVRNITFPLDTYDKLKSLDFDKYYGNTFRLESSFPNLSHIEITSVELTVLDLTEADIPSLIVLYIHNTHEYFYIKPTTFLNLEELIFFNENIRYFDLINSKFPNLKILKLKCESLEVFKANYHFEKLEEVYVKASNIVHSVEIIIPFSINHNKLIKTFTNNKNILFNWS